MSVRVDQADFDELLGLLIAEYSLAEGAATRGVELLAQLKVLEALLEEHRSHSHKKRVELHRVITRLKNILAKDPEHTPLPSRQADLTRSKNSRPPPRSKPPPLPPRKR